MLQELVINDFAIIDRMDINFKDNMTVLTGETGAGKSIIIDALGLLGGGRGSTEFIRKGKKKAVIQGQFKLPANAKTFKVLEEFGIDYDDDQLILQRELYKAGRNVCRVNGMLVNLTVLKKIGTTLIDIHGQNEHQELMRSENHIILLDSFNKKIAEKHAAYSETFQQYKQLNKELLQREKDEQAWNQRLDMLKYQADEIEAASLKKNEDQQLLEEKNKLDNFQSIYAALEHSYQILSGENLDVLGKLGEAMEGIQKVSDLSESLQHISENISNVYYELEDVSREVVNELDMMEFDQGRLDEIEQRLEVIHQLKRKYGDSIDEILNYHEQITTELENMQNSEENLDEQKKRLALYFEQSQKLADEITTLRKQTALKLENSVHEQLSQLYMDKAVFKVKFEKLDKLTSLGQDKIEFYIQTNPGEEMGPLAKIASGGELSRMMLALKTIFSQGTGVTSIIFDEVDTGVSGRVAQAIAEKISQIGKNSQVLCISHLPQVAAIADHHYFIAKDIKNGRTETAITYLEGEMRIKELARMLSGTEITTLTIEHATEMIKMLQNLKQR